MKRGFGLYNKRAHVALGVAVLVVVVIALGVYFFSSNLSGNVVRDVDGNKIGVSNPITAEQLVEGIHIDKYGDIRWFATNDREDRDVSVESVFNHPNVVWVTQLPNSNVDKKLMWYGPAYSKSGTESAKLKNEYSKTQSEYLAEISRGYKYTVYVKEPTTIRYSFE